MTIEVAIDILSDNHTVLYSHGDYTEQEEGKAQSMAIKSLKAWEKVRAEIEKESEVKTLQLRWGEAMGLNKAIEIIDKHLQEVEHEGTER